MSIANCHFYRWKLTPLMFGLRSKNINTNFTAKNDVDLSSTFSNMVECGVFYPGNLNLMHYISHNTRTSHSLKNIQKWYILYTTIIYTSTRTLYCINLEKLPQGKELPHKKQNLLLFNNRSLKKGNLRVFLY